jgi:hypothetical protein
MATPASPSKNLWTEPESASNSDTPPVYPYNNVTQTESGHSFELDDTPQRERVRLQHRSGTFIEMHPNGDEVHKVYGDGYEITIKNKNVMIKGTCNITVEGDSNLHVLGNLNERIDGDYNLEVRGNMIARCRGSDGIQIVSDSDMSITSGDDTTGAMYINVADHVYVASSLEVAGGISGDFINAKTRINAGTGLYAGPLGVFSVGPIQSLVSVTAPLGKFGLMDAVLMRDIINETIYNTHSHIGNKGFPVSSPLSRMV